MSETNITPEAPKKSTNWAIVAAIVSVSVVVLVAILAVAVILVAGGGDADDTATPAPAPSAEQVDPEPEVTVEEDITESGGYLATTTLLQAAWDQQDDPEVLCIVWDTQRAKWLSKFT